MLQLINESLSLVIALSMGIYSYSYMNRLTRTLFFQLIAWVIIFIFSHIITAYQNSEDMNNQWIFNIHVPLELLFLNVAALCFLKAVTSSLSRFSNHSIRVKIFETR